MLKWENPFNVVLRFSAYVKVSQVKNRTFSNFLGNGKSSLGEEFTSCSPRPPVAEVYRKNFDDKFDK